MDQKVAAAVALGVVGAAAVSGSRFGPTPNRPRTAFWYARLRKPSFTPPGPVFGAAWTVLDGLLCYSGYRLMTKPAEPRRNLALGLWGLCALGVGGFSYVLFGRKKLGAALGVTAGMVASSAGFVAVADPVDRTAALLGVPLAAWTVFAAVLQEEVWRRNRRRLV